MKRALLALAMLSSLASPLAAQAPDARPIVEIVAAGGPEILAAMAERARSLPSRFAVSLRWRETEALDPRDVVAPRAADPAVLTRVWLDLRDPARAVLFIANAAHDRFLVRVVPARDGYGELTRESLATIVESAIDALLAGGQIGVERSAALRELSAQGAPPAAEADRQPSVAAPTVVPAAPVEPASRDEPGRGLPVAADARPWLLALHYRGDAVDGGPRLRHGGQLALSHAFDLGHAVDLLVLVAAPFAPGVTLGDAGRRVEQHGGGARAALGATARAGRFGWQAGLGAGVDLYRVEPAIDAAGLSAAAPFTATIPIATVFASGSIRPLAWLDLALGVGLDVDLAGHHFDVETAGARSALISPWRAHPFAFLGAGVPFGGGPR